MAEEKAHAVLSASSSHKWLVCTPSARLEEKFPSKTSEYMAEGTLAHEIAEFKIKSYFIEPISKSTYSKRLNKFKKEDLFNQEMLTHTETYLEFIKEEAMQTSTKPFIAVEQRVDFSKYVPEGFGTADCIFIKENTLHVIDFKYGKGVKVEAEENPQMKLYALGVYEQYKIFYNIKCIKMSIVQPRIDNISSYETTVEELLDWGEKVVKPQAQKAFMGIGEFVQGEHCKFCKAKGACEFRAHENMKVIEEIQNNTGVVTNAELGEILTKTDGIEQWLKDIRDYALSELLKGHEVPGWKAVEGKSNRKLVDVDKAFEILEASGYDQAILYEKKPLSLLQLEKAIGKKQLVEAIGDYIEKPKGAPTLAKESDKREPFKVSAAEEFKNIESEEN